MDRSNDMCVVVTVAPVVLDAVDEHEDRAARADIAHLVIVQVGAAALARHAAAALRGPTQPRGRAAVDNDHMVDGRVCLAAGIDVGFARGLDETFPRAGAELGRLHVPAA